MPTGSSSPAASTANPGGSGTGRSSRRPGGSARPTRTPCNGSGCAAALPERLRVVLRAPARRRPRADDAVAGALLRHDGGRAARGRAMSFARPTPSPWARWVAAPGASACLGLGADRTLLRIVAEAPPVRRSRETVILRAGGYCAALQPGGSLHVERSVWLDGERGESLESAHGNAWLGRSADDTLSSIMLGDADEGAPVDVPDAPRADELSLWLAGPPRPRDVVAGGRTDACDRPPRWSTGGTLGPSGRRGAVGRGVGRRGAARAPFRRCRGGIACARAARKSPATVPGQAWPPRARVRVYVPL